MNHIFISYSHKDKEYAHKLKEALEGKGFQVWIDDHIDYGDEWPMVIQDRLDECAAFILIATENSYSSTWVRKEVTRAQRINKTFFPLLRSGQPWLTIESTQYVDVRDGSLPTERFYQRLRSAIRPPKPEVITPVPVQSQPPKPEVITPAPVHPRPPKRPLIPTELFKRFYVLLQSRLSKVIPGSRTIGLAGIILVILSAGGWGLVTLVASLQRSAAINSRLLFSVVSQSDVSVYSYDIPSSAASPLDLGAGKNWDPTISRFGNIYFTSNREDGKAEIYRLVNGVVERVTDTPGNYQSWDPALSGNGTLYFTSNQEDGKAEIYRLVNARPVRVTDTPGEFQSWGPVISPNGNIYYTTNRDAGKARIYRLLNGTPQRVTYTPEGFQSWGPAIGPSGIVYFTTDRDAGNAEIYRIVMGSSQRVTDTPFDFQSWGPAIGSDGTIYYTSDREDGRQEVYKLVDGEPERVSLISGQVESFTDRINGISPDF